MYGIGGDTASELLVKVWTEAGELLEGVWMDRPLVQHQAPILTPPDSMLYSFSKKSHAEQEM